MRAALRPIYGAAAQLARLAAAVAPAGASRSKLVRTLSARRGLRQRYRRWGATRDRTRPLLWMHAPSVGEGLQARPVLERMRSRRPQLLLAYTFFSPSAERFAQTLDVDFRDYLPFDTVADVRVALDALGPAALVFSKVDVWPQLVREAARRGTRLGLVSATLAAGSSRRRSWAAAWLRDAYAALDAVGAIDPEDAARLTALGVRRSVIEITGDTRYDQVWARAAAADRLGPLLGPLASGRATVVAGSTWPSDEAALLPAFESCRRRGLDARLVVAPHEPTAPHLASIERWARGEGRRIARLDAPGAAEADVLLVDRVGVLGDLYALADVAYVGGAFHAAGLHSVLEPAAFGAPVLFGPRHDASRDARLLLASGGARTVADRDELAAALFGWLSSRAERSAAGARARATVEAGLGAADRSTELVARLMDG